MSDIVITEFMDRSVVDELSARFDVHYSPTLADNPKDLKTLLLDARAIIIRNRTKVNGELLNQSPKLQVVGRLGIGLDNIDMLACKKKGITVYPATGANNIAVAEYVISAALILSRNVYHSADKVIAGSWPRESLIGREVNGQTLGLIGCGGIAREIAKRAKLLGITILAYDPYIDVNDRVWEDINRASSIDELLKEADIISLHLPLTDSTRNFVDAKLLLKIKPKALIINTSRGGIVDELALIKAMQDGRVGGAAIDVFSKEPVDEKTGKQFANIPNLLLTPHIAGITKQSNLRVSLMIADKISTHLRALNV